MPQIYHTVPCYAYRGVSFVMQLLIEDEGRDLLPVFVEYGQEGHVKRLRMLPTDGYRDKACYSLYSVCIPQEHLFGACFSYRLCIEDAHTAIYTFPLKNVAVQQRASQDALFPAVLPLWDGEEHYLAPDAPLMRFVSFPQDIAELSVCADIGGTWERFPAFSNEFGMWECRLPRAVAKQRKNLRYYVEARGRVYEAALGSEREPLSVRFVDEMGPEILCVTPAAGETATENPPVLRAEYADASGVDLSSSKLFLDGKSVSENANWTENGASFRPNKPLCDGEHVWEISLRDARGNRTYQRVSFFVKGEAPARKKPLSAVRAAGFLANAFATLKNLFLDKD